VERDEERTELEECVLCEVVWVLEKGLEMPGDVGRFTGVATYTVPPINSALKSSGMSR
jgi:hypothetical protein